jgi:hypothetical protein
MDKIPAINRLRKEHKDDNGKVKTWHVQGEDPNPDMGGSHGEPTLGFFEGTFEQVLAKAISIDGFFAWYFGGKITEINIVKL